MKLSLTAGMVAGLLLFGSAPALAAPVTVDLRVEGATRTLFEGPVTTDVRQFPSNQGAKACDTGTGAVTRGAVIAAAGVPFSADWNDGFGNPTFKTVDGENVDYDPATQRFFAEFLNGAASQTGSCTDPVQAGDQVLFAYAAFDDKLLKLTGPATAKPGESVTLTVTDGTTAVAGATVGGRTTGPDGTVTVGPLTTRGENDFKASADKAIRSNRVRVCVTDGADGACGTTTPTAPGTPAPLPAAPDRAAPKATLSGLRDQQTLTRGPRELRGSFADASGVKTVKLRLTKRLGKKCWYFSGRMEKFRGTRCGRGPYFAIDAKADWSYLLPAALGKGRYVLDAIAIDGAGNRTPLARGTTRVVFTVR
jgi:hypothetical protein